MGSGISSCSGPSSVDVKRSFFLTQPQSDNQKQRGHCDPDNNNEVSLDDLERHFFDSGRGSSTPRCLSSRPNVRRQENRDPFRSHGILKQTQHSIPSLASFTIKEEEESGMSKSKKRQSAKRVPRPKSANVRKRRNTKSEQTGGSGILEKSRRTDTSDDDFSDLSDSSSSLQSDFDDDVISIPDETQYTPGLDDSVVKLGPQFVVDHGHHSNWWDTPTTDIYDVRHNSRESGNSIMKKASERSISSIILTSVEFSTNTEWCGLTNDAEINRIRQKIESVEDALWDQLTRMSSLDDRGRYEAIIRTARPQFVKLLSEFSHTGDQVVCDMESIHSIERMFSERLKKRHSTLTRSEFSMMVAEYLQAVEGHLKSEYDVDTTDQSTTDSGRCHFSSRNCKSAPRADVISQTGSSVERTASLNENTYEKGRRRGIIAEARSILESHWLSITYKELTQLIGTFREVTTNSDTECRSSDFESLLKEDYIPSLAQEDLFFVNQYLEARRTRTLNKDDAISTFLRHLTEMNQQHIDDHHHQQQQRLQQQQKEQQQIPGSNGRTSTASDRSRPATDFSMISTSHVHANLDEKDSKSTKSRPDSGVVVTSSSASYSSSEAAREDIDVCADTSWITASLDMLDSILQVRTEDHTSIKSLTDAITRSCSNVQLKVHAIYRWLASQSLRYYSKVTRKGNSPTDKMKTLADGKTSYSVVFQELAKTAGLKCERIEGFAKTKDYLPGSSVKSDCFQHSWNAVFIDDQYRLLDVHFASLPYKFFTEHFFMTPPDEFRLSHFPSDRRWLLMNQSISLVDFEDTLKTWPAMFAFNIRPLSMKATIRTFDGRLSITVLLQNVAVTPHLQYDGPGPSVDNESLTHKIDTEIRSMDSAETFHMKLPHEGVYYFTLLVHDIEEGEDIPAFQYKLVYKDELL